METCSPQLAGLITGSVEQMKAQNKWGLYLVEGECVTISSSFILRERVYPKLDPQSDAGSQKLVPWTRGLVTLVNITVRSYKNTFLSGLIYFLTYQSGSRLSGRQTVEE